MAEKIGVYFDQSSVGPAIDLESLAGAMETKFSAQIAKTEVVPILATDNGKKLIQADIDSGEVESVIICGASPRADWDYYDFGREIPVERVNLRELGVMCYQNPDGTKPDLSDEDADVPELLTELLTDNVAMSVRKMQAWAVPEAQSVEAVEVVMVLGGGWTGLNAALDVAKAGLDVVLVEKADVLGGKAATMFKSIPLAPPFTDLVPTGVDSLIAEVEAAGNITVVTGATLTNLQGTPGEYKATLSNGSDYAVGSVILATGWVPQETKILAPLGYGTIPNVVTTAEFEAMAKAGTLSAKRVAFVLNVESCLPKDMYAPKLDAEAEEEEKKAEGEEEEDKFKHVDLEAAQHLAYSNSVNSTIALKQARYVTDAAEGNVAYVFYDSMIVQGVMEKFYKAAQDVPGVMMTKADIQGIEQDGDKVVVKAANTLIGGDIEVAVDLVVLPTGMVPTTAKAPIMNFEYRQGPAFPDLDLFDGFADSNYICFPYETRRTGVYAAGAVRQPMLMDQAADDASGAALKAIQCISSSNRGVSVHPRSGDESFPDFNMVRCTQCKRCTEECPFGALDDDEKGTPLPNPTRCRRCGTCMGACPERVITFANYGIGMLSDMVKAYNIPDDMAEGGPRILIMACENDAYPALDMAAQRGHSWSPYVRIMPVRCLGSVNAIWVKDAMSRGTDGVMLLGCKYGDDYQCHFVKGSEICNRRKENIAESLKQLGVEPERVEQYEVAIDDYDKIPGMIEDFLKLVMKLGPNPFKGY